MGQISPDYLTSELFECYCDCLIDGLTTRQAADKIRKDRVNIAKWLNNHATDEQRNQYARSLDMSADFVADDAREEAYNSGLDVGLDEDGKPFVRGEIVQRSRLKVDTLKWIASKRASKRYGEKTQHEMSGPNGGPIEHRNLPNLNNLTDDELQQAEFLALKLAGKSGSSDGDSGGEGA